MTDPVLSRLLAALEALERTIEHAPTCRRIERTFEHVEMLTDMDCDCDYDVRRRLAIAQRTEAAVRAAVAVYKGAESSVNVGVAAFASPGREREDT